MDNRNTRYEGGGGGATVAPHRHPEILISCGYRLMNPKKILNDQFVKLLLESLGDGVFTLDSEGFITSWNPAMLRITGYGADEAIGKSCGLMCFSQCFGKQCPINPNKCGIFDSGKVDPTECYLKHKSGRSVPVIKNARVIRKPDGSVIGIVEAVTDLTELEKARKKMAEDSLRLGEFYQFENIIGKSHVMQQVFLSIKAAAACNANVLIQGESGTGKELVAGAIHFESDRKNSRMITVNCSALPESLLESELFGHIRGAFTGALRDRKGRFEDADGGTIFLDEIGEISPLIQLKLLRVLEEHSIERVGESKSRKINIRIITATNQDLFQLVNAGDFREDLYYRLKVFPIYPPPLRKRKEDIPLLVNHFIDVFNQKSKKTDPGNFPIGHAPVHGLRMAGQRQGTGKCLGTCLCIVPGEPDRSVRHSGRNTAVRLLPPPVGPAPAVDDKKPAGPKSKPRAFASTIDGMPVE